MCERERWPQLRPSVRLARTNLTDACGKFAESSDARAERKFEALKSYCLSRRLRDVIILQIKQPLVGGRTRLRFDWWLFSISPQERALDVDEGWGKENWWRGGGKEVRKFSLVWIFSLFAAANLITLLFFDKQKWKSRPIARKAGSSQINCHRNGIIDCHNNLIKLDILYAYWLFFKDNGTNVDIELRYTKRLSLY